VVQRARTVGAAGLSPGWLLDLQDLPAGPIATDWWPVIDALARRHPLQLHFASGERWLHRPVHRLRFWRTVRA
jgi:hypothetical protein